MTLGAKLRVPARGGRRTPAAFDREMTQQEVVRLIRKRAGQDRSQSYLSQIESGARPHLTQASRMLLVKIF